MKRLISKKSIWSILLIESATSIGLNMNWRKYFLTKKKKTKGRNCSHLPYARYGLFFERIYNFKSSRPLLDNWNRSSIVISIFWLINYLNTLSIVSKVFVTKFLKQWTCKWNFSILIFLLLDLILSRQCLTQIILRKYFGLE